MGYNIAMICDFFYPQLGGVEIHIYHLAQNLISLGHNVVIITHAYGNERVGVRYLTNGLKVYYTPLFVLHRETTFPSVFSMAPILRHIMLREKIDIVHGHGSGSAMAQESIVHANTLGMKTVFTDHSLYGFSVLGSILLNKLLLFTLGNIDRVICVSNICKDNMIVRANMDPSKLSVIPNAVISDAFKPLENKPTFKEKKRITIVAISRLFPNKGADLIIRIIPKICQQHPEVDFLLAGDGPKFVELQQTVESFRLQDRVTLLGAVPHENIREVLCKGDIYLHTTLTEAFGTVLVEAASCGLLVVTTHVGGIPEVLPDYMTVYAMETSVTSLVEATNKAIELYKSDMVDTSTFHDEIKQMYDWMDIAKRTSKVYDQVMREALPNDKNWYVMLKRVYYRDNGRWARLLLVLCCIVEYLLFMVMEFFQPEAQIEKPPKWPHKVEEIINEKLN
ncbi:phosphatidylinositol N-acetylglucosaminyltransferase GPI3 subunit [Monosporozyma unispora]